MIPELGHFALWLAAALACAQLFGGEITLRRQDSRRALDLVVPAAAAQAFLCVGAFAMLIYCFAVSDFSVKLVATNSHTMKPFGYKLTGAWANHEGSMLLWVTVLAFFAGVAAFRATALGDRFRVRLMQVTGALSLGFYSYLLISSNPFERLTPAPSEGNGLNPLLQDPGLAFHPPLLYLGYVGLSIAFAFAVAALIERQVGPLWARTVKPWILAAWAFLTAGITLGSFWAYYELGWGGWWFWDPVENASLMPWLAATALFHSTSVLAQRDALRNWTILLAVAAFSFSMIGTFIVRSGLLTSVHAFAVDPERGFYLLVLLGIYVGGALALYAVRAGTVTAGAGFRLMSREGALVINNLLLSAILGVVFIGTMYPVGVEAITGARVSVGPPYFEAALIPLILPLLLLMAIGPFLRWKKTDSSKLKRRLFPVLIAALAAALIAVLFGIKSVLAITGVGIAAWLAAASIAMLRGRRDISTLGTSVAHLGAAILALGVTVSATGSLERTVSIGPGEVARMADFKVRMDNVEPLAGPNYTSIMSTLSISRGGTEFVLRPERRAFVRPMQQTTETDIAPLWNGNLYAVLGEGNGDGRWQVRLNWQPLIALIWIGGIITALGGMLAIYGRAAQRREDRRQALGSPAA
ncbi:heme lyase CcmF/NrfE family subunit [Pacificimonas sp. WHA3]|uniref:Heme lyase CcmF/NrfE family subunit n=1 Tax=Pacificimonas pallii TaxID=2827236 RepID=A0ABS6SEH9_9SPHN|nr:heme lyase CcmF/NrfE family subunit [Pacificimonas pallii]MBV7256331.1 heme lyase CcmF/NrfE family subunit [Pacificimonas pallii]